MCPSCQTELNPPVRFYPEFLDVDKSMNWFSISKHLAWARGEITLYGKKVAVPREESLFGDDLRYTYRGSLIKAEPWPDFLLGCVLTYAFGGNNTLIEVPIARVNSDRAKALVARNNFLP